MLSLAYVILSTRGRGLLPELLPELLPGGGGGGMSGLRGWVSGLGVGVWSEPERYGYCSGRYASYWNAFLYFSIHSRLGIIMILWTAINPRNVSTL